MPLVTREEDQFIMRKEQATYILPGMVHSPERPGKIPLKMVEFQSDSYLGEVDIKRLEDVYSRRNGE